MVEAEEAEAGKEPGLGRRWNLVFVIFLVKNLSSLKLAADAPGIPVFSAAVTTCLFGVSQEKF